MTNPSCTERSVDSFPSIPSCKVPLALKRSVAANGFLNKICFNEGYLSGPKVCRSNLETPCRSDISSHVLNEVSHGRRCRGCKYIPLPQCLHLQSILNVQGRTLLAYLVRNMFLSKQAWKRTFQESWEEKYFCCAQDDNVRCLLCSKVQKGTHKWNIKRHYDTVLCSKFTADAANLSVFTLRHVLSGLRCATSSWGYIEYMIADAWYTVHTVTAS